MMAKPTARLDLTFDELDAAMDGCISVINRMNDIAKAPENASIAKHYRNACKRYDALWGKLYDAKLELPKDSDT